MKKHMSAQRITIDRAPSDGPHALLHTGPTLAVESYFRIKVEPKVALSIERGQVEGVIDEFQSMLAEVPEHLRGSTVETLRRMGILNEADVWSLVRAPPIFLPGFVGAGAAISPDGLCVPQISPLGSLSEHDLASLLEQLEVVTQSVRCHLAHVRDPLLGGG